MSILRKRFCFLLIFILCGTVHSERLNVTVKDLMEKIHKGQSQVANNFWIATEVTIEGLSGVYPVGTVFGKLASDFAKGQIGPDSDEYAAVKLLTNLTVTAFSEIQDELTELASDVKYMHLSKDYDDVLGNKVTGLRDGVDRLLSGIYDQTRWHEFCVLQSLNNPEEILNVVRTKLVVNCRSSESIIFETNSETYSYAIGLKFFTSLEIDVDGIRNSSIYENYKRKLLYALSFRNGSEVESILEILKTDIDGQPLNLVIKTLSEYVHHYDPMSMCWSDDILSLHNFDFDKVSYSFAKISKHFQIVKLASLLCVSEIASNRPDRAVDVLERIINKSLSVHKFTKTYLRKQYNEYFDKGKAVIDLKEMINSKYHGDMNWNYTASASNVRKFIEKRGHKTFFFNVLITPNLITGKEVSSSCTDDTSCYIIEDIQEVHVFITRHSFDYGRNRKSLKYLKENKDEIENILKNDYAETINIVMSDVEKAFPSAHSVNSYKTLTVLHYFLPFGDPYKYGLAPAELSEAPACFLVESHTNATFGMWSWHTLFFYKL